MKGNCYNVSGGCCKNDEFIKSDTYEKCVYHAFYDKNDKKYSHQRRIPKDKLDTYKGELLPLKKEVKNYRDFDSIYELFKNHKTNGIGELTIYDVSLRISQNYGIYPDKVYLHAGTKKGAINTGLVKPYGRKDKLTVDEISAKFKWLKGVEPYLIEDFLCIYKDNICEKNYKKYRDKSCK